MYHTIFFDLDGTLTDSKEGIMNCVRYALETLGRPPLEDSVLLKFVGPPLQESFQTHCGLTGETLAEAIRLFRSRYDPKGQYENRAAPGAAEMLARLKARGIPMAVASSKIEPMCRSICQRFGFAPSLAAIVGSPPSGDSEKAAILREAMARLGVDSWDASRCLMVGDRKYDVAGAKACGMDCLGVEFFGYADPGELEEAGAAAVVKTMEDLESFLLERCEPRQRG